MMICVFIFFLQAILVTHGGLALTCYKVDGNAGQGGLTLIQWLICIAFAFIS